MDRCGVRDEWDMVLGKNTGDKTFVRVGWGDFVGLGYFGFVKDI